jgi:hypothetical protein
VLQLLQHRSDVRQSIALAVALLAVLVGLTACRDGSASASRKSDPPQLRTEVVQLRRDYVLHRVEVSVTNRSRSAITVDRLRLSVKGFELPGWLNFDAPLPPGQTVNLPVPFRATECPPSGDPKIGKPHVDVRTSDSTGVEHGVKSNAAVSYDLLQRLATRSCVVQRVTHDVALSFDDTWSLRHTATGNVLDGALRVRLLNGGSRRIMQLIGANMYALRPLRPPADASAPLAIVTPDRPVATIPVVARAGRCDGHTKGEIKQPYEFLVWVAHSHDAGIAITPQVGEATKTALRKICAF